MLNLTEPADGTRLAAEHADGTLIVIYRDDHSDYAYTRAGMVDDRWIAAGGELGEAATWAEVLQTSVRLYSLVPYVGVASGDVPAAVFSGEDR